MEEHTRTHFYKQTHASHQPLRAIDDVVASIVDHSPGSGNFQAKKYCIEIWSLNFVRFFVCTRNVN
jgi:hypothetical protein